MTPSGPTDGSHGHRGPDRRDRNPFDHGADRRPPARDPQSRTRGRLDERRDARRIDQDARAAARASRPAPAPTALLDPPEVTAPADPRRAFRPGRAPGRPDGAPRSRPTGAPRSVRGRRMRVLRLAPGRPDRRIKIALTALVLMLLAAVIRLSFIQGFEADKYADRAVDQRTRTVQLDAQRGSILDRNGAALAFTIEGRAIAARPLLLTDPAQQKQVVDIISAQLGTAVDPVKMLDDLVNPVNEYVYLARGLMPDQADAIMNQIAPIIGDDVDAVVTEEQPLRQYPDAALAESVVGKTSAWDGNGLSGVESRFNSVLAGTEGSRTVDVYGGGVIPGSARDVVDPVNGADVSLTLDFDLQYAVNQMLSSYVDKVGAKRGMALVEDVKTGQIYAIGTYQPGATAVDLQSNMAVTSPFEPGSVNKVVTFAAALDAGIITPTTQLTVDGQIEMGGRTIHDAWGHGPIDMTATGILAKSSNVGTLMRGRSKKSPMPVSRNCIPMQISKKPKILVIASMPLWPRNRTIELEARRTRKQKRRVRIISDHHTNVNQATVVRMDTLDLGSGSQDYGD